jgi:hypothetical protein|tara:strand:- start:40 stop:249 length:210 start_codon:yes stop_codon:yes gene_type:complete
MKIGDLVFANYDEQRGLVCIGLVLETRRAEVRKYSNSKIEKDVKVIWCSPSSPTGWWREDQLRIVSEGR